MIHVLPRESTTSMVPPGMRRQRPDGAPIERARPVFSLSTLSRLTWVVILAAGFASLVSIQTARAAGQSPARDSLRVANPDEKISPFLFRALGAESAMEMLVLFDRKVD